MQTLAVFLARLGLGICLILNLAVLVTPVEAQPTTSAVAIGMSPRIMVTGSAGSVQLVQYSTNLADPNGWNTIGAIRIAPGSATNSFYDDTSAGSPQRFYRAQTISLANTNLVWIPPGTFLMGSPTNEAGRSTNEGPQTLVTFTYGFFMSRYLVTLGEWYGYTNFNSTGGTLSDYGAVAYTNTQGVTPANLPFLPINYVAYADISNYCAWRTATELAQGYIPPGWVYRLPTEAEWEYACRGGTTTPFSVGNGTVLRNDTVQQDAWFNGANPYPTNLSVATPYSTTSQTVVGRFSPNPFGLYDMQGNLAERCLDVLPSGTLSVYPGGSVTNPPPATSPGDGGNIVRGGYLGYASAGTDCRSAARANRSGFSGIRPVGFRVILTNVKY